MTQRDFSIYLNECLPDVRAVKSTPNAAVYSLILCPQISQGTRYKFVRIVNDTRVTVAIGRARSRHKSLNLAEIRQLGAQLEIDEVHVLCT